MELTPVRLKLIACEVMFRELCACVADSTNIVDLEFLPKGLHDIETPDMVARLQACIDAVTQEQYDAALLAYALCNNGTVGLRARSVPLVIPRAHDCITLLMGSRQRYQEYFDQHPGTFFRSPGWMERDSANVEGTIYEKLGLSKTYQQMVEQYGEDNAKYIMETMAGWTENYTHLLYIDTGVGRQTDYQVEARREAEDNGWTFETMQGDRGLLQRLVDGQWDDADFLVVPPGQQVAATHNGRILAAASGASG